ncbi:eukaryotic and archaeal DNA primase small subunit [Ascodesmis nigricans]|uniref:DNA primase n=1 Tax=Ascodesmis nigricans TaxID=341454 RepID=A0A4S2N429_9PEZI|nr:eukaryotic and archaeal DNA primase small subunit [Ascodesmis nigricans]
MFDDDEDLIGDDGDDTDLLTAEEKAKVSVKDASFSDPQVMYAFYQRLFPWRQLFQWLNHSPIPSNDFMHREFAFTLQNEAYLRYQSFPTFETLRKEVLRLNPSRFEIGPVYSANPRDRKALRKAVFKPINKELVFDIDLTDYDDVRTCCDKANICEKCWQFITVAIKIMDVALREDLGFKHIMWVYSGRRGAHAWVCDKKARQMDDGKRKAVAAYLEVIRGGAQGGKRVHLRRPLHPHLTRSMDVLKDSFTTDVLINQDPWREPEKSARLLHLISDKTITEALREKWNSEPSRSSVKKWADIDEVAKSGISRHLNVQQLRENKQDIVFEYLYPRLDVEVSKHLNHLLKSPFVVHPGTGRVCVPIDATRPEDFDPLSVPTVTQLLAEIDATTGEEKMADYEKTSLKPYVDFFKRFVAALVKDETTAVKREREKEEAARAAAAGPGMAAEMEF